MHVVLIHDDADKFHGHNERQYGSATLNTLKNGVKQMSDEWVDARIFDALGGDPLKLADYYEALAQGKVTKILYHTFSDGHVEKSIIDSVGNIIDTIK